jgi:uncharacterized protein YggE
MEPVMPPKPIVRETTIAVTAIRRQEIAADKADLQVTIKGSSLVTGSAALKKAKEVNELVTALLAAGVKEEEFSLRGIQVQSASGVLARTSSALYSLRIRCARLELLGDILGAISAQKNVSLDDLTWRYPELTAMQNEWLDSCIAEARQRAAHIANALGVKLLALHSFSEAWKDQEEVVVGAQPAGYGRAPRLADARMEINLGFNLSHSKVVEQRVDLTYVVDHRELVVEPNQR